VLSAVNGNTEHQMHLEQEGERKQIMTIGLLSRHLPPHPWPPNFFGGLFNLLPALIQHVRDKLLLFVVQTVDT
jgi:hypothetical protein